MTFKHYKGSEVTVTDWRGVFIEAGMVPAVVYLHDGLKFVRPLHDFLAIVTAGVPPGAPRVTPVDPAAERAFAEMVTMKEKHDVGCN